MIDFFGRIIPPLEGINMFGQRLPDTNAGNLFGESLELTPFERRIQYEERRH